MRKGVTEDREVVEAILEKAEVLWLALVDGDGPYSVPVSFAEEGGVVFIHSGKRGRKAEALKSGGPVAFSCAVDVRMREGGDDACDQGYHFRSVMGRGVPRLAEGEEKMRGLDLITVKYLGRQLPYVDKVLPITDVWAIDVDTLTARIKE
ncbi:pyridoxamine 5'-phosphate oxidase family protein [Pseudodesulfovibrio cashew]|uniref:Pyridoxamine 5'-phosphate oxidase family protein n=1 Tax=Pseudodesulfovibrio cashew TaxID=2678688 RepID=A0A6I6JBM4_9BACT|nr:pyridoxamine 5'-phosphate oxidase family protein [Pseudodesulfovibrio cashew]QGY40175.1 pyridoxamine 5'-phosphate oxidase family protein [Pseudodesulfovibrio cashew]